VPIGLGTTILSFLSKVIGASGSGHVDQVLFVNGLDQVAGSSNLLFQNNTLQTQNLSLIQTTDIPVVNGFSLTNGNSAVKLSSVAPVVSNALAAIASSPGGGAGSIINILNDNTIGSGNNITFLIGANVILPGNVNLVLTPQSSLTVIWNGTMWVTIASSINS
jgi:hypothetical protein